MHSFEEPEQIDPDEVLDALAEVPALGDNFKTALSDEAGEPFNVAAEPAVYLLRWGGLNHGAVRIGRSLSTAEEDEALYTFSAHYCQFEGPSEEGSDGENIAWAEFVDVDRLDFSAEARKKYEEKVPELEDPSYFLYCYSH